MEKFRVVLTDYEYESLHYEIEELQIINAELVPCQCKTEEDFIEVTKDADALLVQYGLITRRIIENLTKCQVIVRYGVGTDNIDIKAATEFGIPIVNVPDYGISIVADHTLALILACSRKLTQYDKAVKSGEWNYRGVKPLFKLSEQKLGILAFGNIARMVAERAKSFGISIQVCDPYVDEEIIKKYGAESVDFETLITTSDIISIHAPYNESTFHLFNKEVFKKMKHTAILINTSRGPLVDEADLADALRNGEIAFAGLDVAEIEPISPDNPLLKQDNLIITPHAAWYTEQSQESLQRQAAQEVVRVLSGKPPKNLVNTELKGKFA